MPDLTEYIETSQAAEKLHYHVEHVRRMMREGSLQGIKIGRTWLVQRKSLDEYVAKTAQMSKHDPRRTQ
jgi:excisionase family DNA binding protein